MAIPSLTLEQVKQLLPGLKQKTFLPKFVCDTVYVIKVYDGDTITIAGLLDGMSSWDHALTFSVRIDGIDAPEMRGGSPDEKRAAVNTRDRLRELLLEKFVTINVLDFDKYGRILARISVDQGDKPLDISNWLLANKWAVPYNGGTKSEFDPTEYNYGSGY